MKLLNPSLLDACPACDGRGHHLRVFLRQPVQVQCIRCKGSGLDKTKKKKRK